MLRGIKSPFPNTYASTNDSAGAGGVHEKFFQEKNR